MQSSWYNADDQSGTIRQYWHYYSFTTCLVPYRRSAQYRLSLLAVLIISIFLVPCRRSAWYYPSLLTVIIIYNLPGTMPKISVVLSVSTGITTYLQPAWYHTDDIRGTICHYRPYSSFTSCLVPYWRSTRYHLSLLAVLTIYNIPGTMPTISMVLSVSTGITTYLQPAWYHTDDQRSINCQYWHYCLLKTGLVPNRRYAQY